MEQINNVGSRYRQTKILNVACTVFTRSTVLLWGDSVTRRRSRLEIYLDVLGIVKNGTRKPTRIMYGANLSWKTLRRILRSMVSQGLIEEVDARDSRDKRTHKHYELTQKGENVIRYFNQARNILELEDTFPVSL